MTVDQYLEFERTSDIKHDFVAGSLIDVRAKAGTTESHGRIQVSWLVALHRALDGKPCEPFGSDLKIRSARRATYRYPDISVAYRPLEFDPRESAHLTLLNPKLIIEILSDSTEMQDRTDKFTEYREIDSFREYVLTSQNAPHVECYYRQDDGRWLVSYVRGLDKIVKLQSLDIEVQLREIYAGVEFPPENAESLPAPT